VVGYAGDASTTIPAMNVAAMARGSPPLDTGSGWP
jgi:hypothetical protein